MVWYIAENGQAKEMPEEVLIYKIQNQEISPDILVVNEEIKNWIPLKDTQLYKWCEPINNAVSNKELTTNQGVSTQPETEPKNVGKQRKSKKWLLWAYFCIMAILLISGLITKAQNDAKAAERKALQEFNSHVINCARTEVSKNLKSPATAIWGTAEALFNDEHGRYVVYVPVEAQNGFGGYSKHDFLVVVMNVDADKGTYSSYTYKSILDVTSYSSAVSKLRNGEPTELVRSFLELNHWGEERT